MKSNFSFIAQFLRNPKEIGAILPSSPLLGKAMAAFAPKEDGKFVVELGPGTGPITKELLKAGLNPNNLVCLEQSEKMVKHLIGRFPHVEIIHGDACELASLLNNKAGKVHAIVSSLPFKSIPDAIVYRIIDQMYECLEDNGTVIQFTYDLRKKKSPLLRRFHRTHTKIVLGNIPPARVCVFQKISPIT